MPQTIALVACVKTKANQPRPARDLYVSDWFVKASAYAEKVADAWYILSAKHGLVGPNEMAAPYEKTLKQMPVAERRAWADQVFQDLCAVAVKPGDRIVILAGKDYREHLVEPLQAFGCRVEIPMEGLRFGNQKSWLKRHT
jgi:hypothetical protein